jgi:hypothetical protein
VGGGAGVRRPFPSWSEPRRRLRFPYGSADFCVGSDHEISRAADRAQREEEARRRQSLEREVVARRHSAEAAAEHAAARADLAQVPMIFTIRTDADWLRFPYRNASIMRRARHLLATAPQ